MADIYVLDEDREPVPTSDLAAWFSWMRSTERTVAQGQVGPAIVITTFVGVDMRPVRGSGSPLVFETRVTFNGSELLDETRRYARWDDAVAGHAEAVRSAVVLLEN